MGDKDKHGQGIKLGETVKGFFFNIHIDKKLLELQVVSHFLFGKKTTFDSFFPTFGSAELQLRFPNESVLAEIVWPTPQELFKRLDRLYT